MGWTFRVAVLLVCYLLISGAAIRLHLEPMVTGFMIVVATFAVIGWGLVTSTSSQSPGDASVWDAIPDWQYDGRHVESGGLTRDEQERALQDIERRAEQIERVRDDE